jgi:hypothetical protein
MDPLHYNTLTHYLTHWTFPENATFEEQKKIKGQAQSFLVKDQVLYKKNRRYPTQPFRVIQEEEVFPLLTRLHSDPLSGHFGIENTFNRTKNRYYWPQMYSSIRKFIQHYNICQRRGKPRQQEPLHPLPVSKPFDRVGIDLLQLPITSTGHKYVIVATDYLTKWVEARALPDKTASCVAGFFYEEIICRHGAPKELLSDQGKEFLNQLIQQICDLFGTTRRVTTPYHPQTNGLTERFNRTLINALGKLIHQYQDSEWDELLTSVLFAYRTMQHSTTGYTPFYLLYSHEALLPLEFSKPIYSLNSKNPISGTDWIQTRVTQLQQNLNQAQDQAQTRITQAQTLYKQWYDAKRKVPDTPRFQIGDQVLRHRVELGTAKKNKLEPQFDGPYYIHDSRPQGVYKLRLPSGQKLQKLIHGNQLKHYNPPSKPTPFVEIIQWPATPRPKPVPQPTPSSWSSMN